MRHTHRCRVEFSIAGFRTYGPGATLNPKEKVRPGVSIADVTRPEWFEPIAAPAAPARVEETS